MEIAVLGGITEHDERWVYSERYDMKACKGRPNTVTQGMNSIIVPGHSKRHDLIQAMPSALVGTAVNSAFCCF